MSTKPNGPLQLHGELGEYLGRGRCFAVVCPAKPGNAGAQLHRQRMDLGLTAKQAARLAGVDQMSLIAWEIHGRKPQPDKLRRLLGVYERVERGHKRFQDPPTT